MSQDMQLAKSMAEQLPSLEESIAYLESREDFQQAKSDYQVYLEERKPKTPAQRTEHLNDLPLHELVKVLDEQLPFDLVVGITDFLQELGAFNEALDVELPGLTEGPPQTIITEEILIAEADLDLLASVLPPALASKLSRSPLNRAHEEPSALKASLLNTLARLALSPPLTIPISRSFRPIFVDLASRWLLLLGFTGTGFEAGHASTNTFVRILAALARTLPEFPHLYPILLLALHHPHLQAESVVHLLSSDATFPNYEGPSSAINPSATISDLIYHPDLLQLLLTFYSLLVSVPHLPLLRTIRQNLGGPAPPDPIGAVLASHPQLATRTLAWHVAFMWFGWNGPKKEELRRKYVYDPLLDQENGSDGRCKTDIPLRDLKEPLRREEWLSYWPRIPEHPLAELDGTGGLKVRLEVPQIDVWIFEKRIADVSNHEWTVARAFSPQSPTRPSEDGILAPDALSTKFACTVTDADRCPLLAQVAGIPLLKEAFVSSTIQQPSQSGNALKHAQRATVLPEPNVFVPTSTSIAALRQLAVHVSARIPVLLGSPPSAGKATTLQELHRLLYEVPSLNNNRHESQDIVTINLADKSLDAKNLIGSLTSSPTEPGAFVFAEGSLTRAMRYGRWVVLEDIDKASDEVLSTISELVERIRNRAQEAIGGGWGGVAINGVGVQAGGNWVEAAENFMMFATRSVPTSAVQAQSTADGDTPPTATFFGSQYWSHVWMETPDINEIQSIVEGRFPRLAKQVAEGLVQTWATIVERANSIYSTSSTGLSRTIGMRDLVKWCRRIEEMLPGDIAITTFSQNPRFQDEVFLDARDIFLSSFPARNAIYDGILEALRTGLEISQERLDWALQSRIPEVTSTGDKPGLTVHYGRVSLTKGKFRHSSNTKRPYALTKPFLLLLEELAAAVKLQEPVLLVGETGTGKTTAVTQLAEMLGHNLTALNLSNQTEASDLLGGFKPINEAEEVARSGLELVNQFTALFAASFEASRNLDYGLAIQKAFKKKRWSRLAGLFREAADLAGIKLSRTATADSSSTDGPRKKRKTHDQKLLTSWTIFKEHLAAFEIMANEAASKASKFKFTFVEGPLIRALRNGEWVLLDEVNLATSETLESLSSLLQSASSSLVLTERGDLEPIHRHPDFRIFACMNPATDIGKRDLPPALRVKFTEIFVTAPDADKEALLSVIHGYIGHVAVGDRGVVQDIAELYLTLKELAQAGRIADGSNHPPHFSMRTLARSLVFTADFAREFGIRRAAYEGIAMCFTTSLDASSKAAVHSVMHECLVERSKSPKSFFKTVLQPPRNVNDFVSVGTFWLAKGKETPQPVDDYVLTASVEDKLISLARAIAAARFPILLQGPTSSGKTSIIEYLARRSGHNFVRINNHEHTDIQEYLGTYMSDPETGKLVFQEGLLVKAVREGHWIVLDELNLAPTDVLEALNRLLDDNRELVVPETQEVVKPHPHFMLFATQNPPGLYGGRKVLSRAFRNRFLEMQFSDVPQDELETILCQRCRIAPSYAKKIVAVFLELQRRRQNTRLFEEKQAFVTLRDLFRWGNRAAVGYEQLALDGYMLLAERTRKAEDKETVREVIEQIMKVSLTTLTGYETVFDSLHVPPSDGNESLVWTTAMKRLYVLIRKALSFDEPVLLVGETGSGKTSVCQAIADGMGRKLHIINCHQNTETSDLIGSQRPVRNKKAIQEALRLQALDHLSALGQHLQGDASFEAVQNLLQESGKDHPESAGLLQEMAESQALFMWHDGPLIEAMRHGDMLLLDEISLADDSVLERLNSVLEPARTLTIAEKGSKHSEEARIQAHTNFQIIGTMNPGGDFGKKELSPALRNRFTEIWVPWLSQEDDILGILCSRLGSQYSRVVAEKMLHFAKWFTEQVIPREAFLFGSVVTLRDLLAWTDFMTSYSGAKHEAFVHGALMTMVDALGSTHHTSGLRSSTISSLRERSIVYLEGLIFEAGGITELENGSERPSWTGEHVFDYFLARLARGDTPVHADKHFSFSAPTVRLNTLRVMRALQVSKPILLEGSPGVGKTSLVTALAKSTNHVLCRINLSDQTDLVDLFGSDSPVEGGKAGEFAWVDAPFLSAMQAGHWVLLDEMNLASQSVLEGLNSCLDHRGTVYIPELDKVFSKHPEFRIFAAQNPTNQGGSRKGLPRSFVDRFTQVYMDDLEETDYFDICRQLYSSVDPLMIRNMVTFVVRLAEEVSSKTGNFARGAPWELNLRDLLRWLSMMTTLTGYERHAGHPAQYLDVLFVQRFREPFDRECVVRLFEDIFGTYQTFDRIGQPIATSTNLRIGANVFSRLDPTLPQSTKVRSYSGDDQLRALEALSTAVANNQLVILTGPSSSGKSAIVQMFAALTGRSTRNFHANAQTDTLEMLGSFEQYSIARQQSSLLNAVQSTIDDTVAGSDCAAEIDWNTANSISRALARINRTDLLAYQGGSMEELLLCLKRNGLNGRVHDLHGALAKSQQKPGQAGRFEFVDGILIEAMVAGDILVVENANRCNPAVLDRLNGLFEPGGKLVLSERGLASDGRMVEIQPHPNFRVIMTLDPRAGELSRAMRNRGIEIALVEERPRNPSHPRLSQQIIGLTVPHLSPCIPRQEVSVAARVAGSQFDKASLVHALGKTTVTNLPCLQRKVLAANMPGAVLQKILENTVWSTVTVLRPGKVADSLPGQSHAISFFGLDTNEALTDRSLDQVDAQFALDRILSGLIDWSSCHQYCIEAGRSILSKPVATLTVLEQAYLHSEYPARLPIVPKGVESITALQGALLGSIEKAIAVSTLADLADTAIFIQDMTTCLAQFLTIFASPNLNYTAYQALLVETRMRLPHIEGSANLRTSGDYLRTTITLAEDSVKRSTGHNMEAIWAYIRDAMPSLPEELASLGKCDVANLPADLSELYMDVVKSGFESKGALDDSLLVGMRNKILETSAGPRNQALPSNSDALVSLSELSSAAQLLRLSSTRSSLPRIVSSIGDRRLSSLTPILSQMTDPARTPILMVCEWLDTLVSQSKPNMQIPVIEELLTDMELRTSLDVALSSHQAPLAELPAIVDIVAVTGQAQFELTASPKSSRHDSLTVLALTMLVEVLRASGISSALDGMHYADVASVISKLLAQLSGHAGHCTRSLCAALHGLAEEHESSGLMALSRVYICLARWFWGLYVPDIPLDPLLGSQALRSLYERETASLMAEAAVENQATRSPGGRGARRLEVVSYRLKVLEEHLKNTHAAVRDNESTQELLTALFTELRACTTILLESDVLDAICDQNEPVPQPQLENLQASLVAIHTRLKTFYTSYSDIVKPVTLALGSATLGLGISIYRAKVVSRERIASIVTDVTGRLVARPSLVTSKHLVDMALPTSTGTDVLAMVPPASGPLLTLRAITASRADHSMNLGIEALQQVCIAYERLYTLWSIDHKRAEQERLQAESIYRSRREDVEIANDNAQEEADLLSIFPTFEGEDEVQSSTRSLPDNKTLLRYEDIRSLYEVHTQLFSYRVSEGATQETLQRALARAKHALLVQLHTACPDLISETVDMNASPAALDILADVAHSFSKDQADGAADFYHDANVAEARKLRDLLQAGLLRLNELMAAWPEQMVLVELADRCKALLAVPSTAPLAKLLAFVESLLLKMTDWEAYASRDTSLSDFSGRLTALVVDWRRLELKSWAGLLETQEREFRSPIAEWWFRMYDLCIQGPIAPSDNNLVPTLEAQNEYLETLLGMLRTFIEQTPAGQFRDKLSLVESFGYLAAVLRTQSPIFPRISSALLNLSSFYETQALRIDIFLREEKKKIAKDVNDVIRLASWKDVNVYALKASAQKSHRQLYKRVRALRKVLESPSSKFVDDTEIVNVKGPSTRPSMCQPSALIAYSHDRFTPLSGLSDIVLPKPLVNIETTLSRLMKIVQDDNSVHEAARSEFHLEALAETIITRSQELQAEQPKGSTKDEREKQSKALMDRKRKAWSSLLAEAKRIGLSPRPSTKLVQDLSSMASLLDPGPLSKNVIKALAHFEPVLQSLDNYFHRICSIMPRVRSAASQHHLDVSPSQLQSAAGHLDSAFKTAHASRHDISRELDHVSIVSQAYRKLLVLKDGGVAPHQLNSHQESIHALHSNLFYLRSALKESFSSMTDQAQFMTDADKAVVAKIQVALRECISEIEASKHELDTLLAEHGAIAPMAASHYNTLERARDGWKAVGIRLASLVHTAPQLAYLLKPTLTWMEEEAEASNWGKCAPGSDATDASQSALQIYATTMSAILVSIQALQDTCQSAFEEDGEYAKAGLTLHYKSLIGKARALHTASISQHVRVLSDALAELSKHDSAIFLASQLIDRSLPFLSSYLQLAENQLASLMAWNRALLKFMYIFARTTLTLANEGFCRPLESDDNALGEANNFDGTGMGTGEGSKNVSDQIENQEQVEGLEDQQEGESPDDKNDTAGTDEMLDMDDDFGGKTQDVAERDSDEPSDNDEDEQDENDLDEELGKVDPLDPTAVDDKFWDDKNEEQQGDDKAPPPEEQSNQNAGAKDTSEIGERQEPSKSEDRDEPNDEGEDANGQEGAIEQESADERPDQDDGMAEEIPENQIEEDEEGRRQELPEVDMEERTLDLPEDMNLDPHSNDEEDDAIDDELIPDQLEADRDTESVEQAEQAEEEDVGEQQQGTEEDTADLPLNEDLDVSGIKDPALTHESIGTDESAGNNTNSAQGRNDAPEGENHAGEPEKTQPAPDTAVEQDAGHEQAEVAEQKPTGQAQGTSSSAGEGEGGEEGAQTAPNQPSDPSQGSESTLQDDKQLGDANQAFMRRLEAINQASDKSARDHEPTPSDSVEMAAGAEVEHIREGEEESGLQATGAADEDSAEKHGFEAADTDMLDDFQALDLDQSQPADDPVLLHQIPQSHTESRATGHDEDLDMPQHESRAEQLDQASPEREQDSYPFDLDEPDALNEENRHVEIKLQHWLADGRESLPSEEVWRLYTNLTRDLSFSLTESLRLVLEPTLATRLKGDYRTGKRLNMRKIIPYIASDYTKDKIWLRRTRPSQREYQVLLALDDSRSMADSRAVHLAYQTLALVSQSLTKLEVGEVAICKFGQQTNFVHNFEDGSVSETAGARIVDSFQFAQTSTDVKRLLENSLERFQAARERRGGSAADLWQLEIIISDGMCQDLEDIRSLLRKARQQKIMVMFVVLDSLHSGGGASKGSRNDSILSLKSVSYQKSKSGALELKMERYMDTFPFEYYVVLRDVEALPEVLGETLRQFFDKVRGDTS